MNHVVTKTFRDQTGEHTQGEMLDLSVARATKLISLGYVRVVKEATTQTVNVPPYETNERLEVAKKTLLVKEDVINDLSESLETLDDQFKRLDTAYAEKVKELESVMSRLTGFVTSVKSAKVIAEVKVLADAFEKIEAAK